MTSLLESCRDLPELRLPSGMVLLDEGTRSGKLFILIEGEVQVLRGGVEVATVSEPGSVFGEMSILLEAPHTATVRTLAPTHAYVVENAEAFLSSSPEVLRHIGRLLAFRLQSASGYLADLKRQFADSRSHLGMVDEVLESLLHQQDGGFTPGSDREADPRL
jgi:CRP-like cAMP-binding protein